MSTQGSKEGKPFLTARELCVMALLTVILFAQEQMLNFLPNINFTILLMVLYAKTLGFAKSSMIITVYLLFDAIYMNSLNPIWTTGQWIGWMMIPILMCTVFKKTEDSLKLAFAGALCAFLYCWILVFPTMWVLHAPFKAYLISDIPYELLLAGSAFLGILLLYEPLSKLLRKLLRAES